MGNYFTPLGLVLNNKISKEHYKFIEIENFYLDDRAGVTACIALLKLGKEVNAVNLYESTKSKEILLWYVTKSNEIDCETLKKKSVY